MEYIEQIGYAIGIRRGKNESIIDYHRRIAYSMLGDWMQTAVHIDGEATSIVQVKRVVGEKIQTLQGLTNGIIPYESEALIEHMYNILLANGVFLHRNYYVRPAPRRLIGNGMCAIVRGMLPEENVSFSGLAPYIVEKNNPCDIYAAFGLSDESLDDIINLLWKNGSSISSGIHIDEFLNTKRREKQPYYCTKIPDGNGMNYGRIRRENALYDYYLIYQGEIRRIPEDYVNVSLHEYARLQIMTQNQEQTVVATFDGTELVHLNFSFHLPKPELRFLRYITWPSKDSELDDLWNFCMKRDLWPILKARLEFLKYKVVEKHA